MIDYRSPLHGTPPHVSDGDAVVLRHLAIADVSAVPRLGLKGPGVAAWLESKGIAVPSEIYDIRRQGDTLVLRLGTTDFLVEGNEVAQLTTELGNGQPGVYRVERQDGSFVLTGTRATEVLAQMCSIDFASGPLDRVCYTRVAGVSCAILPETRDGIPSFRFWVDYTLAVSLWESLEEISGELGGRVVPV
jgi:sarcosine oxidase subunit gamma